jgi:lipopolysaccharide transport system permease protein
MLDELKRLAEYREFVKQFALQQLRVRYRGSVLGFVWTLLFPLLTCVSFTLIFGYISHADLKSYGVYFLSGYVPWLFFVNSASLANGSILGNANYVSKILVPKSVFPISSVFMSLVDLLAGLLALAIVMVFVSAPFSASLLIVPVSVVLTAAFTLGVCLLFASLNVFLRDFGHLWAVVSFLWFFFTPILYPMKNIPAGPRQYFELNPILPFIRLFQNPISNGTLPDPQTFLLAAVYSVASLLLGFTFFARQQRRFYLYL